MSINPKWMTDFFQQEEPTGLVNGSNTSFTLAKTPATNKSIVLYLNGIVQRQGGGLDYTISGSTITMTTAPANGQELYAFYLSKD